MGEHHTRLSKLQVLPRPHQSLALHLEPPRLLRPPFVVRIRHTPLASRRAVYVMRATLPRRPMPTAAAASTTRPYRRCKRCCCCRWYWCRCATARTYPPLDGTRSEIVRAVLAGLERVKYAGPMSVYTDHFYSMYDDDDDDNWLGLNLEDVIGPWTLIRRLGKGTFGCVYLAKSDVAGDGPPVCSALKIYKAAGRRDADLEAAWHKIYNGRDRASPLGPHVVRACVKTGVQRYVFNGAELYCTSADVWGHNAATFMRLLKAKTGSDMVFDDKMLLFAHIVLGLGQVSDAELCQGDVKLENTLLNSQGNGSAGLCDGGSGALLGTNYSGVSGSLLYNADVQMVAGSKITAWGDMCGLLFLLVHVFAGTTPWAKLLSEQPLPVARAARQKWRQRILELKQQLLRDIRAVAGTLSPPMFPVNLGAVVMMICNSRAVLETGLRDARHPVYENVAKAFLELRSKPDRAACWSENATAVASMAAAAGGVEVEGATAAAAAGTGGGGGSAAAAVAGPGGGGADAEMSNAGLKRQWESGSEGHPAELDALQPLRKVPRDIDAVLRTFLEQPPREQAAVLEVWGVGEPAAAAVRWLQTVCTPQMWICVPPFGMCLSSERMCVVVEGAPCGARQPSGCGRQHRPRLHSASGRVRARPAAGKGYAVPGKMLRVVSRFPPHL